MNNKTEMTNTDVIEAKQSIDNSIVNDTNNIEQQVSKPISKKKRFEVEIYDKIISGEPPMEKITLEKVKYDKPVIIEASNENDLKAFSEKLSLCQQTFKIVKVLDDVVDDAPVQQQQKQPIQNNNTQTQQMPQYTASQKTKPKYYKVGDIEIKNDNGKIYQKQWLRLSDAEMTNFRIINDKNNSIFNLNGRHIEMKKWVLVDSTDEADDLEENLK